MKSQVVDRDTFKEYFNGALRSIHIPPEKRNRFFTQPNCTLRNIGVCVSVSILIDNYMKKKLSLYDACLTTDTFDSCYEYNLKYIQDAEAKHRATNIVRNSVKN